MSVQTYNEALEFMYAQLPMYQRQGAAAYKKDLTNTLLLCEATGHPEKNIKTIHVAGTNGKGTTSHIIAGGLQSQNLKTGLYTSPHYKDFRERIKINGQYISPGYIVRFIQKYEEAIYRIQPSFFELTFVMALRYFADKRVDVAIIETGLGGRLDSTNVITPLLSVITNISFDHQNMLGNTLVAIAGEKAGIIKNNIPVIIGETQSEVQMVFVQKAHEKNSRLLFADEHIQLERQQQQNQIQYDVYIDQNIWMRHVRMDINGPFQEKNIKTALYTLFCLKNIFDIQEENLQTFFPRLSTLTKYMGRWQILGQNPTIIADSAHNVAGIQYVLKKLEEIRQGNIHFVLGFVNDKDISSVLQQFPKEARYYFAKANIPRGMETNALKELAAKTDLRGRAYSSVKNALKAARRHADKNDIIFIGGSIFVVAECL